MIATGLVGGPISADSVASRVALCTHLSYTNEDYAQDFEQWVKPMAVALGVKLFRDGFAASASSWKGNPVALCQATGGKFIVVLPFDPSQPPATQYGGVATAEAWLTGLLSYLPAQYIAAFESVNEPNRWGFGNWAVLAATATGELYSAVKANLATAHIPVLSPALANTGGNLAYAIAAGALAGRFLCDGIAFHPYPGGQLPDAGFDWQAAALVRAYGDLPLWITETGYQTDTTATTGQPGVPEDVQAAYLVRSVFEAMRRGYAAHAIYEFLDESSSSSPPPFGIVTAEGVDKPAYAALKAALATVSDPGAGVFVPSPFPLVVTSTEEIRCLLMGRRDGSYQLAYWQNALLYDTASGKPLTVNPIPATVAYNTGKSPVDIAVTGAVQFLSL